jgi:hypothetical protein
VQNEIFFLKIANDIDIYFTERLDAAEKLGFNMLQKAAAAMHLLPYGSSSDSLMNIWFWERV